MVRLPSTNPSRKALCHVRLLTRVRETRNDALGFEGSFHRPGASIEMASLGNPAIALECAGPVKSSKTREYLWIVWRLDFEGETWIEVARAQAPDWTWSIALRPAAAHALYGDSPPETDIALMAEVVIRDLDKALDAIEPRLRPLLLGAIDPEIQSRIAAYFR